AIINVTVVLNSRLIVRSRRVIASRRVSLSRFGTEHTKLNFVYRSKAWNIYRCPL
ncbi:hypothetical protein COCCADRAFT_113099, partial [Bipolaris zeicola 26-R-13]